MTMTDTTYSNKQKNKKNIDQKKFSLKNIVVWVSSESILHSCVFFWVSIRPFFYSNTLLKGASSNFVTSALSTLATTVAQIFGHKILTSFSTKSILLIISTYKIINCITVAWIFLCWYLNCLSSKTSWIVFLTLYILISFLKEIDNSVTNVSLRMKKIWHELPIKFLSENFFIRIIGLNLTTALCFVTSLFYFSPEKLLSSRIYLFIFNLSSYMLFSMCFLAICFTLITTSEYMYRNEMVVSHIKSKFKNTLLTPLNIMGVTLTPIYSFYRMLFCNRSQMMYMPQPRYSNEKIWYNEGKENFISLTVLFTSIVATNFFIHPLFRRNILSLSLYVGFLKRVLELGVFKNVLDSSTNIQISNTFFLLLWKLISTVLSLFSNFVSRKLVNYYIDKVISKNNFDDNVESNTLVSKTLQIQALSLSITFLCTMPAMLYIHGNMQDISDIYVYVMFFLVMLSFISYSFGSGIVNSSLLIVKRKVLQTEENSYFTSFINLSFSLTQQLGGRILLFLLPSTSLTWSVSLVVVPFLLKILSNIYLLHSFME